VALLAMTIFMLKKLSKLIVIYFLYRHTLCQSLKRAQPVSVSGCLFICNNIEYGIVIYGLRPCRSQRAGMLMLAA